MRAFSGWPVSMMSNDEAVFGQPLPRSARVCETPPPAKGDVPPPAKGDPPPSGDGAPPAKKPSNGSFFTQAELDEIISDRLNRERLKWETKVGQSEQERAELDKLRQAEKDRKRAEEEAKGNYDRALQSIREEHETKAKTWQEREAELLREIRVDRCKGRLINELSAQGAIDPEDLAEVLATRVDLDEQRQVVVLGPDRKPAFKSGVAVTIKDLVTKYKADKPWAFKADNDGEGANSKGGQNTDDGGGAAGIDADIAAAEKQLTEARSKALAGNESINGPNALKARELARTVQALKDKKKKQKAA